MNYIYTKWVGTQKQMVDVDDQLAAAIKEHGTVMTKDDHEINEEEEPGWEEISKVELLVLKARGIPLMAFKKRWKDSVWVEIEL